MVHSKLYRLWMIVVMVEVAMNARVGAAFIGMGGGRGVRFPSAFWWRSWFMYAAAAAAAARKRTKTGRPTGYYVRARPPLTGCVYDIYPRQQEDRIGHEPSCGFTGIFREPKRWRHWLDRTRTYLWFYWEILKAKAMVSLTELGTNLTVFFLRYFESQNDGVIDRTGHETSCGFTGSFSWAKMMALFELNTSKWEKIFFPRKNSTRKSTRGRRKRRLHPVSR